MLQAGPASTNGRSFAEPASESTLRCGVADIMTALSPMMLLVLAAVIIANFTFQMTNSQTPLFWRLSRRVVTLLQGACRVFNAAWSRLSNTWVLRNCNERSAGPWLKLAVLREFKKNLVPNRSYEIIWLIQCLFMYKKQKRNPWTSKCFLLQQRFSQASWSLLAEGIFPIAPFKITITLSWHLHLAFLTSRGVTV